MVFKRSRLDAAALATGAQTPGASGQVPRFEHERWLVEQFWCWAAATAMVHFSRTGKKLLQADLAGDMIDPQCRIVPIDCKLREVVADALDFTNHLRPNGRGKPALSFADIVAEIPGPADGVPIVCVLPGHCVVIFAWKRDPTGEMICVADPAEEDAEWTNFVPGSINGDVWVETALVQ